MKILSAPFTHSFCKGKAGFFPVLNVFRDISARLFCASHATSVKVCFCSEFFFCIWKLVFGFFIFSTKERWWICVRVITLACKLWHWHHSA